MRRRLLLVDNATALAHHWLTLELESGRATELEGERRALSVVCDRKPRRREVLQWVRHVAPIGRDVSELRNAERAWQQVLQ